MLKLVKTLINKFFINIVIFGKPALGGLGAVL